MIFLFSICICYLFRDRVYLLDVNYCIGATTWCLMNNYYWVHNKLFLKCEGIDVYYCVGVKVWLDNLHFLKRRLKEAHYTESTRIYSVAQKAGNELLRESGHLGLLAWKNYLECLRRLDLLTGSSHPSIRPIRSSIFFAPSIHFSDFSNSTWTKKKPTTLMGSGFFLQLKNGYGSSIF